jgi:16S rRNA (adenine1518-N6/adenine1519-N6)-dimethyltransferase
MTFPVSAEIFDVVDQADRVVGQAPRAEVHARGLLHRAVHILVFNRSGQLFVQQRSPYKDTHPSTWDSSASGHLDAGEDYLPAARRECREELGVEIGALAEVCYLPACPATGMEFVRVYRAHHDGPFVLPPAEISAGRWVTVAELGAWLARAPDDFATSFRYIWAAVSERWAGHL